VNWSQALGLHVEPVVLVLMLVDFRPVRLVVVHFEWATQS
jgi:hypothetical protein